MTGQGLPGEAAAASSPRSSFESRPPTHSRQHSLRLSHMSTSASHRQSFAESLRGMPQSPRARRQPSLTQAAIQGLIDNPPVRNPADPAFMGRDWRQIAIGELVKPQDLRFVEVDTGIEEATNILVESEAPVLLIRETADSKAAIGTFDYNDLNAYLLLVVGLTRPTESQLTSFEEVARKAREGNKVPLEAIKDLVPKEPLTTLPASANLRAAVETFGSGVHRIVVVKDGSNEVVGVVSQTRLVKFLWENGRSFPIIDQLYPLYLKDLGIGSQRVVSIHGDKPLFQALQLMNDEGVSSLPVLDHQSNVIGNISTVDVKLLTKSSSLPLLHNTCVHFISVILSSRGLKDGKDSFPVFYVTPNSTLAHTVAKMVATRSHRLWITDPQASSGPPTPTHSSTHIAAATSSPSSSARDSQSQSHPPPHLSVPSSIPGAGVSGRLVGVLSLTDILNLYARASGLSPADPAETRSRRRRSSSSSVSVRRSGDVAREIGLR
ncbi:hypothetical protein VTN49DRAFT_7783 [Thermomyces lanuginosus]|uniref:uncharacterized protein n=1 Tax=Thermomyces lanuginosus TaxID=5541 RepID=UPI003742352C